MISARLQPYFTPRRILALLVALALLVIVPAIAVGQTPTPQAAPDIADSIGELLDNNTEGEDGAVGLDARVIQLFLIVTVLSLAPGLAMMITCLPFMVIVFSFLRQALGLQQSPPNMMIMGLAMFLTFFVMEPVFTTSWDEGLSPYMDGMITEQQAIDRTLTPFRSFMEARGRSGYDRAFWPPPCRRRNYDLSSEPPLPLLVTSFMLSEIKQAFQIGFCLSLCRFSSIDLLVASILMAMGMMMVPPAVVSLPFKLAFFL